MPQERPVDEAVVLRVDPPVIIEVALEEGADGKIVAAGTAMIDGGLRIVTVRYNADGSPDTSFGDDGKAVVDYPGDTEAVAEVIVDAQGRVLVAGSASPSAGAPRQWIMLRYRPDGTPDETFDGDGRIGGRVRRRCRRAGQGPSPAARHLPLVLWERFFPPAFDVTCYSETVDFEFRDPAYAAEFESLNRGGTGTVEARA